MVNSNGIHTFENTQHRGTKATWSYKITYKAHKKNGKYPLKWSSDRKKQLLYRYHFTTALNSLLLNIPTATPHQIKIKRQ